MLDEIIKLKFPLLNDNILLAEIEEKGTLKTFNEDEIIIDIGDYIKTVPLLTEGGIKVIREDKEGNELLLYYLKSGDTCAMTLTCCMGNKKSEVRAIATEKTELIMIPVQVADNWSKNYSSWNNFIALSYRVRFEELLQTIDSIAFTKMDERLVKYINNRSKEGDSNIIQVTHQEIANDLNTSREVVSRLLKQLEKLGKIKLQRFKIEILQPM